MRFVVDGGIVAQQNNNNMWLAISCIYLPGISTRIAWCVCPCEEKGERGELAGKAGTKTTVHCARDKRQDIQAIHTTEEDGPPERQMKATENNK